MGRQAGKARVATNTHNGSAVCKGRVSARAASKRKGRRLASAKANGRPAFLSEDLEPLDLGSVSSDERPRRAPMSRRRGTDVEAEMRFRFASLVRLSDNLVGRAVQAYDALFDIDPDEKAEIYLDIGREFARTGKIPEALSTLRKAVQIRPDMSAAWVELGSVYMRRQALDAAEQAFRKAVGLGETMPRVHSLLAEVLVGLGRDEEAMNELERCAMAFPERPRIWYQLGVLNDRLGRYEEAIEAFEQAIELSPTQAAYHQGLGFTLDSMGRRKDAIKCFKRALSLEQGAQVI